MTFKEILNEIPMFNKFNEDEKNNFELMEQNLIEYSRGETIIGEGDNTKSIYLLIEGSCIITKTENNASIRLSKIKPGEIFGEMSFFSKKPRKSNVIANEKVVVMEINEIFFTSLDPGIRDKIKDYMIELLINRLDNMNAAIMKISKLMHL